MREKRETCFSFNLDIQTEDIYKDMAGDIYLYDTSNYPEDHKLYRDTQKKALGKMKDECEEMVFEEAFAIRPNMYSFLEGTQEYKES